MNLLAKRKLEEYLRDYTALGNPLVLLLISLLALLPQGADLLFYLMLGGFFWNELFCSGIKYFFHRQRPDAQTFEGGMEKIDAGSFPSIHASRAMWVYGGLAYFFYLKGLLLLALVLGGLVVLVGYTRIFLRRHWPSDVLAGWFFGWLWWFLVYQFGFTWPVGGY